MIGSPRTRGKAQAALAIGIGALVYLLFRSRELRGFLWADALGLGAAVDRARATALPIGRILPEWVLFSLPDGLWVYALSAWMLSIWGGRHSLHARLWISAGLALGLGSEAGQLLGVVQGTYDSLDVLACLTAFGAALRLASRRSPEAA